MQICRSPFQSARGSPRVFNLLNDPGACVQAHTRRVRTQTTLRPLPRAPAASSRTSRAGRSKNPCGAQHGSQSKSQEVCMQPFAPTQRQSKGEWRRKRKKHTAIPEPQGHAGLVRCRELERKSGVGPRHQLSQRRQHQVTQAELALLESIVIERLMIPRHHTQHWALLRLRRVVLMPVPLRLLWRLCRAEYRHGTGSSQNLRKSTRCQRLSLLLHLTVHLHRTTPSVEMIHFLSKTAQFEI